MIDWNWIFEIIANTIGDLLWLIIGIISLAIYYFVKRMINPLTRTLPFDFKKKSGKIYICYGLANPRPKKNYYMVEEGDLIAIYSIVDLFVDIYKRKRIAVLNYLATETLLSELEKLVILSGPLWNRVTELFIGKFGSPVTFDRDSEKVIYKENGVREEYSTVYRKPNEPKICHGIILSGEIEGADGKIKKILLCAGNSHLSTYGSVVFLEKLCNSRKLMRDLRSHGINKTNRLLLYIKSLFFKNVEKPYKWGLIIKVEDRSHSDWHGIRRLPINPNYLEIKVVKYLTDSKFKDSFKYSY